MLKHKGESTAGTEWLIGKRVVFFLNILRDGAGMINREVGFAKELARLGADVAILSYFRPELEIGDAPVRVGCVWRTGYYRFLYECALLYPLIFALLFFRFAKLRPEVVFVDLPQEARFAFWLRPFFRFRVVLTYHGVANSKFYKGDVAVALDRTRKLCHRFMRRADRVIVVSDFLLAETGAAGMQAVRIYNGVDRQRFSPEKRIRNIQASGPLVLFIGRYTEYKGALNIIRAFAKVRAKVPGVELIMHGFFESPSYLQDIEAFISGNGLRDSVYMLGPLVGEETPYRIGLATVFANGSIDETFCMPLLEAQACGVPVVAVRAGGIPEVVVDGETGFLAEPGDIEQYAENMAKLLLDGRLRENFSRNAIAHASAFYYDRLVGELLLLLKGLLVVEARSDEKDIA